MWDAVTLTQWITFAGAIIAAIASGFQVISFFAGKKGKIKKIQKGVDEANGTLVQLDRDESDRYLLMSGKLQDIQEVSKDTVKFIAEERAVRSKYDSSADSARDHVELLKLYINDKTVRESQLISQLEAEKEKNQALRMELEHYRLENQRLHGLLRQVHAREESPEL